MDQVTQIWDRKVDAILDRLELMSAKADGQIYEKLVQVIANLDTIDGRLQPQDLSKAFAEIDKIFSAQVGQMDMAEMRGIIEAIASANISIHQKLNKIKIDKDQLWKSSNIQLFQEQLENKMSVAGIKENISIPVKQMLNAAVIQGKGLQALMRQYRHFFSDGTLSHTGTTDILGRSMARYTRQVANSVTNMANGQIQEFIKDAYGMNAYRYIGNLKKDSRPFCVHMIQEEKYPMPAEKLEKLLKEYVGSQEIVTVTIDGKSKNYKKGHGMVPDTTLATFPLVCGGYNCRHRTFVTRI